MPTPVRLSFCATNLNTVGRLSVSLESIRAIGSELGIPYEVVVADGPSSDGARALLEAQARTDPAFRLVPHPHRNRGLGRRLAFEASSGSTIVPFDTSIVYAPVYGRLLREYLKLETDRMLFSEICALSRRSVESVGGWRDLVGGEDIDLYARVIERFGVVACPLALPQSQSEKMRAFERQWRYVRGGRFARFRRMLEVQRDQIVGANYTVQDLMLFNRSKSGGQRAALRLFFGLAYLASRFRSIRPSVRSENNYLFFRERLLESLSRGDYRELGWDGPPPQLLLTEDEIGYLERACGRWAEFSTRSPPLFHRK